MASRETLVDLVASETNLSKAEAATAVKSVLDGIQQLLVEDGSVTLVGFGRFLVVTRGPSKARNPRTGEQIDVPERRNVKFSAGKGIKEAVR